jgi:hypothetical protein
MKKLWKYTLKVVVALVIVISLFLIFKHLFSSFFITKLTTAQGVLQEIKFNPKYTSTTHYIDIVLKSEKRAWIGPVPTWWQDENIFIFSGKVRTCYEFEKINTNQDINITNEQIIIIFPSPSFCDRKDLIMDIQKIKTQGDRDMAEDYLKGIARPMALLFSFNRGIMDDESIDRDITYFEGMLESFTGKKVEIKFKDLDESREKIRKELEDEIRQKMIQDGFTIDLITTDFMKEFFQKVKQDIEKTSFK